MVINTYQLLPYTLQLIGFFVLATDGVCSLRGKNLIISYNSDKFYSSKVVASYTSRGSRFELKAFNVTFLVDSVVLGHFSSGFRLSPVNSNPQTFHTYLTRRSPGEAWGPNKRDGIAEIREHLERRVMICI